MLVLQFFNTLCGALHRFMTPMCLTFLYSMLLDISALLFLYVPSSAFSNAYPTALNIVFYRVLSDQFEGLPEFEPQVDEEEERDPRYILGKKLLSLGKVHFRHIEHMPDWLNSRIKVTYLLFFYAFVYFYLFLFLSTVSYLFLLFCFYLFFLFGTLVIQLFGLGAPMYSSAGVLR